MITCSTPINDTIEAVEELKVEPKGMVEEERPVVLTGTAGSATSTVTGRVNAARSKIRIIVETTTATVGTTTIVETTTIADTTTTMITK
jgi:hypothetical protein